ncbi:MAG: hypothetical protein L0Z55_08715 [Planctomycetes bacterium]|nr:hypothetical protein [Planctomycetota bacterium]
MTQGTALEIEDLCRLLPQRPPMLLLDRVIALVPRSHAVGIKLATGNEYGLSLVRHGFVFPSSLALEALAQLATVALNYPPDGVLPKDGSLARRYLVSELEQMEIEQEMSTGDRICLSVNLDPLAEGEVAVRGVAHLGGTPFVTATFRLAPLAA